MRRLRRIQEKKAEKLKQDIIFWNEAEQVRAYIQEMERHQGLVEELEEWVDWVKAYADSIDPLKKPDSLVFDKEKSRYW